MTVDNLNDLASGPYAKEKHYPEVPEPKEKNFWETNVVRKTPDEYNYAERYPREM